MRKFIILLISIASVQVGAAWADDTSDANSNVMDNNRPCGAIAKACLAAGYSRGEGDNKRFWQDCMHPLLLNKSVDGVTLSSDVITSCRKDKIESMKNELQEYMALTPNNPQ